MTTLRSAALSQELALADSAGAHVVAGAEPKAEKLAIPPKPSVAPVEPPSIGPPHMKPAEIAVLQRLMTGGVARYLEFGGGGSTLLAARSGIGTIVSVESDVAWARALRTHGEIAPLVRSGTAAILHADIGPTKAFGAPTTLDFINRWPAYIRLPWAEWDRRGTLPQLVLVDGRFRVAACLSVIVAAALGGAAAPGPVVVLHDVVPERKSYDRIFAFFDSVEVVETLHVLRAKPSVPLLGVLVALLEAQFDAA